MRCTEKASATPRATASTAAALRQGWWRSSCQEKVSSRASMGPLCRCAITRRMSTSSLPLLPADVESIERATLAAMPPSASEEHEGWLLAFDPGTVGRAHSAVPLRHEAPEIQRVAAIEQ